MLVEQADYNLFQRGGAGSTGGIVHANTPSLAISTVIQKLHSKRSKDFYSDNIAESEF